MTNILTHRGPDDTGYELFINDCTQVGLGQRRLSIIDLSKKGHQPMWFEQLIITYNGEIYNFKEIRSELEKLGYVFESQSDTEVIIKAFHKWGPDCVQRFIGMFVFAIFDKMNEKLFLFRDRPGIKPLYYYNKDNMFLFASELKSFHEHPQFKKSIDSNALALYLQYGYIPAPHCIFKNTFKLRPGHYAIMDLKSKKLQTQKYWDVFDYYNRPLPTISDEDAISETERILKSAFKYRMVSDVPVGVFLSGGYDSSAVTAILQSEMTDKLKTYTIGFYEDRYNEADYAKEVASYLGTDHTEYYCTQKDALEIIPKLPYIYDEPFADSSAIPTALVSQLARQSVKVVLSADAGDETFAGYDKYNRCLKYYNAVKKIPHNIGKMISRIFDMTRVGNRMNCNSSLVSKSIKLKNILHNNSIQNILNHTSQYFVMNEVAGLMKENFTVLKTYFGIEKKDEVDILNHMLAVDYVTYMVDDILRKVDGASMSVSLESREPLLDHRIIEFVGRLPSRMKYRNGISKWILKKIIYKYVPKDILDRPKTGFQVPVSVWFKKELKEYFDIYLEEKHLLKEGLFNIHYIGKLKAMYFQSKNNSNIFNKLWILLMFEMWYERWILK